MGKRIVSLVLAWLLIMSCMPIPAFASEVQTGAEAVEHTVLEVLELPAIELSYADAATYALDDSGNVSLRSGNYVKWFDRLDLSGASYAKDFQTWLEQNTGTGGALADPTKNTEKLSSNGKTYYVYKVTAFENKNVGTASTESAAVAKAEIEVKANFSAAAAYTQAVYHAFDRDHPEVFWLSGMNNILNSWSYTYYPSTGKIEYSQTVYFLLKGDGFDIRADEYQNVTTTKNTISNRDSNVRSILNQVTGTTRYEQIRQINKILTEKNCYNTSSNINNIGHDCRECVSALEGRTGKYGPVCEAYARALKVLCDELEIPCVLVDGNAGEPHMWNYVQMEDGKWYGVDITWNDPVVSGVTTAISGYESEKYLFAGATTVIDGKTFLKSHPVSNTVSSGGTSFTNGPVLAQTAYQKDTYVPATGISLNKTSLKLNVGDVQTLVATVTPGNTTDKVTWSSSNPSVATVSGGKVTAVAAGKATITAKAGNYSASCVVEAANAAPGYEIPVAKALTYSGVQQELVEPGAVTGGEIRYSLDGGSFSSAVPKARAAGTYKVTYKIVGNDELIYKTGEIQVTISRKTVTPSLTGSVSKVYDGTTEVPPEHSLSIALSGVVSGDTVTASADYAFRAAAVGTTMVDATNIRLSGADSGNYSLSNTTASASVGTIYEEAAPDGELTFATFEELQQLAKKAYSNYTVATYTGSSALTFKESITLPENLDVSAYYGTFIIPEGVTVRIKGDNSQDGGMTADQVIIYGCLENDAILYVFGSLNVYGELDNRFLVCIDERYGGTMNIASGGAYGGNGAIAVYTQQTSLPESVFTGLDLSGFATERIDGESSDYFMLYPTSEKCDHIEMVIPEVPATCTQTGLTQGIRCGECGEILQEPEVTNPLGHSFDGGYCTRCGEPDGDVDLGENIGFENFEELKAITAYTYSSAVAAIYTGTEDLVITEDITIPSNLDVIVTGYKVTVPKNVTLTLSSAETPFRGILTTDDLIVRGNLVNGGDVTVFGKMTVSGSVKNDHLISAFYGYNGRIQFVSSGSYSGSGMIAVFTTLAALPSDAVTGLDLNNFTVSHGSSASGSYFILSNYRGSTEEDPEAPPVEPETPPVEPEIPSTENSVTRVAGESRYETSLKIADEMKRALGISKFEAVILANSDNFADALAGSYLAAVKEAPIIIGKQKYAGLICDYLNENLAPGGTVYFLGGEDVMPESILDDLYVKYVPVRLAGDDRYLTNLEILNHVPIGNSDILVATGRDFADSLSASATGLPILLVNGKAGKELTWEQKEFLSNVKGDIYIIGGESAVPSSMEVQINRASGKIPKRIAGGSRYETSIEIAEKFLPEAKSAVVAYASTFPDGLCGGPLAYAVGAPLILTKDGKGEAPDYTEANAITSGYVLGGDGLISDGFAKQIFGAEEILR